MGKSGFEDVSLNFVAIVLPSLTYLFIYFWPLMNAKPLIEVAKTRGGGWVGEKGNLNFAFCTVAFVQMSFSQKGFLELK